MVLEHMFGWVCRSTTPPGDGSMARATAMETGGLMNLAEMESVHVCVKWTTGNGMISPVLIPLGLYVNHPNCNIPLFLNK